MKNQFNQPILNLIISFTTCFVSMIFFGEIVIADEINQNSSLSLQKSLSNKKILNNNLIPMPIGDFDSASERVNKNRNPFKDPAKSEITNVDNLHTALKFKGVVLSGNELRAIIKTEDVQKFYEVGDIMENGFTINSISYEDITVDVSNGSKKYRLTLSNFKNLI